MTTTFDAVDSARAALDRQDPRGAVQVLDAFLAAHPDDVEALTLLAAAQDWLKEVAGCAATLERLVTLAPERIDIPKYRLLVKLRMYAGDRAQARAILAQGIKAHPAGLELHVLRATLADSLEDTCAELEQVLAKAEGNPRAALDILNTLVVNRAKLARERKGLPRDGLSWADTSTWSDPEGLARYRDAVAAQYKVKGRIDLLLDAACVAVWDHKWDRVDELLEAVRGHVPDTIAGFTAFGDAFHKRLDAFDYETMARLLPPVNHILSPAPRTGETMLLASDPGYFRKFTLPFLAAAERMAIPFDVQVHIMGGDLAAWCQMAAGLGSFRHINVALSAEDPGPFAETPKGIALYAHAIRFVRLYQEAVRNQRRMWVFDVDAFIQRDPRPLFARLDDFDVALRTDPCLLTPPARVAGNLVGIAPTPAGLEFARRIAAYIMYWKEAGTWAWGLDQIGLLSTLAYVNRTSVTAAGGTPRTYYQDAGDTSNLEDSGAIFYFPTGAKKYFAAQSAAEP